MSKGNNQSIQAGRKSSLKVCPKEIINPRRWKKLKSSLKFYPKEIVSPSREEKTIKVCKKRNQAKPASAETFVLCTSCASSERREKRRERNSRWDTFWQMKIDRGEGRGERRGGNIEVMELPSTFRPAVVSPMRPMCWVPPSPQPANLATQPRVVSHTRR